MEGCCLKSISPSDSYSDISRKTSWKESLYEHQSLFYGTYVTKNDHECQIDISLHQDSEFQKSHKLSSVNNGSIKEIHLTVCSTDRYRFGRRSSIVESMLGFRAVPFVDSIDCLMIAEIIDNSLKSDYPFLKQGDWFVSLDNIEVRAGNIEKLLMQYTKATKVTLTFKGSCHNNLENKNSVKEVTNFADYTNLYTNLFETNATRTQNGISFLTLIINKEYFKGDKEECMFYYPHVSQNFLYKAKGSFFTLDSVLKNDLVTQLLESTLMVNSVKYYVTYNYIHNFFIICAYALNYQNKKSAQTYNNDFMYFIKMHNLSLNSTKAKMYLNKICDLIRLNIENKIDFSVYNLNLEAYFHSSLCLALPKEAQLRVHDALSELQSMDFKKWNETQKNSRDLIVCGAALYYQRYLIMSDLPIAYRMVIESFLRIRGIFAFMHSQDLKELFIWEKFDDLGINNTHYVAACIHNNLLLAVVLENTLSTVSNLSCVSYMEEICDTLEYLISCGIESISQFWMNSNKRPSTNIKVNTLARDKCKLNQKHSSTENIESNFLQCDSSTQSDEKPKKKCEQENTFDWQAFAFKNEFKEVDQSPHYVEPLLNEINNMVPLNLTAGWSNNLIYYIHVNVAEAEVLHPLKPICSNVQLNVIKYYISKMHKVFKTASNLKLNTDSPLSATKTHIVIKEQSITLDISNSPYVKENLTIIGRLFTFPLKEVYVCFGKNISQNLVEVSFRMSFLNIG